MPISARWTMGGQLSIYLQLRSIVEGQDDQPIAVLPTQVQATSPSSASARQGAIPTLASPQMYRHRNGNQLVCYGRLCGLFEAQDLGIGAGSVSRGKIRRAVWLRKNLSPDGGFSAPGSCSLILLIPLAAPCRSRLGEARYPHESPHFLLPRSSVNTARFLTAC
jgi:hypothetical protein